jgi:hypothetical protein
MHDTDVFARMPALDSIAGQPPINQMLHSFELECEVTFKGDTFRVRDNGAVFRHARPNARPRKHDEVWTFGTVDKHKGYPVIGSHVVHQIVASAFHGPRPSKNHVVDHIDTNRQNNRLDNLRWVTRLENILLNPITCARIVLAYGSLEAFFENPRACTVPNWDWMRTVTKEEAQECRRRLLEWAEKGQVGRGGILGDWLYKPRSRRAWSSNKIQTGMRGVAVRDTSAEPQMLDTPSLTAGACQRKWRTPTEFPECPASASDDALRGYLERLKPGVIFAQNQFGASTVVDAGMGSDRIMSVVCNTPTGVKDWTHAKVFVDGETFCHEAGGTFFTQEGAMIAHCMAIDAPFDACEGSIDDHC